MAIVNPTDLKNHFRGKIGGLVYSLQPNGTMTVRSVGRRTAPSTQAEMKGQQRLKLGHAFVKGALSDPNLRLDYEREAQACGMRTWDAAMSDFMRDPVIAAVDTSKYSGQVGSWLIIMTGDDFKVVLVRVVIRNAAGDRLEDDFAQPAQGSVSRVWIYTAKTGPVAGQNLLIEVTAVDRPGHSTRVSLTHAI